MVNIEGLWRVCIVVVLVINICIYIVGYWVVVLGLSADCTDGTQIGISGLVFRISDLFF